MINSLSRRQYLASVFAAGAAVLTGCATAPARPKTYVLVHGAYHGGWFWKDVQPMLEKMGGRVYAPTLKGLAERQHENGPDVTLDTHVSEVLSLLDREQLTDVILVGHSYAGMVITGVCDLAPERIAHVVYLDAFLPQSGQSLYAMAPPDRVQAARRATKEKGDGYKSFPPPAALWGLTGDLMNYVNQHMTPHPANTFEQPLVLRRGGPYAVPRRTYIGCNNPPLPPLVPLQAQIKADLRWNYLSVETGHEIALTHPRLLADILENIS